MTFAPVVLDDEAAAADGLIEAEVGAARIRIGRKAEVGMELAVIGAMRGRHRSHTQGPDR